ncbi:hypothetical protein [Qipengyuania sp. RANM35]|uniref:5-methylcytosine restriction system specificity protein McrC n=1 Tax=Qipengyuania sp. RANM35 TaxID=3068635 RepID=UPI0034DADB28
MVEVGKDDAPELQNLFAKLLIDNLHRIIRRGLSRGYVALNEDLKGPRGRLLLDEIIKRQTLLRGEAACQFDELQTDILKNQIVKATARMLGRSSSVTKEYRHELGTLVRRLEAVSDIRLSSNAFRRVQISRNDRSYAMLMKLCEFVFQSALPDENGSDARFADVLENEATMSAVFEDFLRNFYAHEQKAFAVSRDQYLWDAVSLTPSGSSLLPVMQTDIILRSASRTIVADAKYYKETLKGRDKAAPKINSSNLYQLFTYLHHARIREPGKRVDGMLIYPSVGYEVGEDYEIAGNRVRITTINLDRPWPQIHDDLLALVEDDFYPSSVSEEIHAS